MIRVSSMDCPGCSEAETVNASAPVEELNALSGEPRAVVPSLLVIVKALGVQLIRLKFAWTVAAPVRVIVVEAFPAFPRVAYPAPLVIVQPVKP